MSDVTNSEETTKKPRKSKKEAAQEALAIPKPAPDPVRLVKELEVELTDRERLDRMTELLKAMQHVDELVAQKTLNTSEINADIKTAKRDVRVLQAALNSGKEKRDVECIETMQFPTNTVVITRVDTGAIVEKRAMNQSERQASLPLPIDGSTPKPGEPLGATIAERVAAMKDEKANAICGAEVDGRICTREPHPDGGAHTLEDLPAITAPQAILDGAKVEETNGKKG